MQVSEICPDAAGKRTLVMGIVNVTEDSFSDGGKWINIDKAIAHGRELVAQGADMIDVGGESTRPGATRVEADVERERVTPVVEAHKNHSTVAWCLDCGRQGSKQGGQ